MHFSRWISATTLKLRFSSPQSVTRGRLFPRTSARVAKPRSSIQFARPSNMSSTIRKP